MKLKSLILIVLALLVANGCSSIQRYGWTKTDKVLFATACAANAYDFYTTKRVLDNGGYIKDPWPILYGGDETPSTGELALSKAAQLGIAWVVLDRVPSKYRKVVLFLMTGTWAYYGATNEW